MLQPLTECFLALAERALPATALVLAVLCLRALFRRAPKWVFPLLWGLVALKLAWPFTLKSTLSLLPPLDLPASMPTVAAGSVQTAPVPATASAALTPVQLAACIWLAGAVALTVYLLASSVRLCLRVKNARRL